MCNDEETIKQWKYLIWEGEGRGYRFRNQDGEGDKKKIARLMQELMKKRKREILILNR